MDYFSVENIDAAWLASLPNGLRVIQESLVKCLHLAEQILVLIGQGQDDTQTARSILRNHVSLVAEQERASAEGPAYVQQLRATTQWNGRLGPSAHDAALQFTVLVSADVKSAAIDARMVHSLQELSSLQEKHADQETRAQEFLVSLRRRLKPILKPGTIGLAICNFTCELDSQELIQEMVHEASQVAELPSPSQGDVE